MAAIFAHDHRFITDGEKFFSPSSFPESVLRRYVRNFGRITVISRTKLVLSTPRGLDAIGTEDGEISFFSVDNIRSVSGVFRIPSVYSQIKKIVSEHEFVVARLPSAIGLLAIFAARDMKLPVIIEVVGNALEANRHHGLLLGKILGPAEHLLTKYAIQTAPHVIYITKRYLQTIYPAKGQTYICPNAGIAISGTEPPKDGVFRNGPRRVFRLGLIGSLGVRYKGHRTAISVLKVLASKYPCVRFELEFLGGGDPAPLARVVEEHGLTESVRFKGSVAPGPAVFEWLGTLDCLIQPSKVEAQGRSILEAMSCGCAVAASSVGGITELLSEEVVAEPDDVDRFAEIVGQFLLRERFYQEQIKRNRAIAREYSSVVIEHRRDQIFEVFKSDARSGAEGSI